MANFSNRLPKEQYEEASHVGYTSISKDNIMQLLQISSSSYWMGKK